MSRFDAEFIFENYLTYFGGPEEVRKSIEQCPMCGSKLAFDHMSDYKNLIIEETIRCYHCDFGEKHIYHILN